MTSPEYSALPHELLLEAEPRRPGTQTPGTKLETRILVSGITKNNPCPNEPNNLDWSSSLLAQPSPAPTSLIFTACDGF